MPVLLTAPLICTTDFSVDSVVLGFQPFSIRLVTVDPVFKRTTAGRRVVGKHAGGRRLVVQWGEALVSAEAMLYLRATFASLVSDLAWTEPTGAAFTFHAAREPIRAVWQWDQPGFFQPLILTFRERPPAPAIP
jgi:hypothetical protein